MSEPVLELIDWKTRNRGFVSGPINLSILPGRIVAVVGANGAGKTTLLNSLVGLLPRYKGVCNVFGKERHRDEDDVAWKQDVGFVAQEPLLYLDESLRTNLDLITQYFPGWRATAFGEDGVYCRLPLDTPAREVSKEQRWAFALMMTLSWFPKLLILDEPLSGLDKTHHEYFLDRIERSRADEGTTILVSSRLLNGEVRIADEICFMNEGKILLHQDRESIVDGWYKLSLEHHSLQDMYWEEIVQLRQEGSTQQLVTRNYEATRQHLADIGATVLDASPLKIEDAARYLMEEE